jgi:hypothetical protein
VNVDAGVEVDLCSAVCTRSATGAVPLIQPPMYGRARSKLARCARVLSSPRANCLACTTPLPKSGDTRCEEKEEDELEEEAGEAEAGRAEAEERELGTDTDADEAANSEEKRGARCHHRCAESTPSGEEGNVHSGGERERATWLAPASGSTLGERPSRGMRVSSSPGNSSTQARVGSRTNRACCISARCNSCHSQRPPRAYAPSARKCVRHCSAHRAWEDEEEED